MPRQKFKIGDRVVVPHGDKQYSAKVLKSELREGVRYYLLHYLGWKKKWDEWMVESDIQTETSTRGSKTAAPKEPARQSPSPNQLKQDAVEKESTKAVKRRKADEINRETQLQLRVDLPVILKKQLLDEYDLVTSSNMTATLPRKPNAMQILRQFYEYGKKELRCTNTELQMLVTGLEEYMDKTLEDFLLYETEWKTAAKLLNGGISASSVYGAEHLLRLIVKLPELLPQTSVTVQQERALQSRICDFLDFLVINRHTFFANVKEYSIHDDV